MNKITTALLAALVFTQLPGFVRDYQVNQCVAEVKSWDYAKKYPDSPSVELRAINSHCYGG